MKLIKRLDLFYIQKVKMGAKSHSIHLTWLTKAILVIVGGDLTIRLWNCESNDTYILPMPENSFHPGAEQFTALSYGRGLLTACTNLGSVSFWAHNSHSSIPDEEWQFAGLVALTGGPVMQSVWSSQLLYVHNGSAIYSIQQQQPYSVYANQVHRLVIN